MSSATLTLTDRRTVLAFYAATLLAAIGLFFAVRYYGEQIVAPAPTASAVAAAAAAPKLTVTQYVLATLAAVIVVGNVLAILLKKIGQTAVIGEVIGGILLGPSVLGAISPDAMHFLIPAEDTDPNRLVVTSLNVIAQVGIVLYMFIVGLELNPKKLRGQEHIAVAISHASILLPFVFGSMLALWIYPRVSSSDVSFTSFALFLGAAMSITAFPILARILKECNIEKTDLGVIALSCAATDDVTAWCLLALVVGVAKAEVAGSLMVGVWALLFIAFVLLVLKPLLKKAIAWAESRDLDLRATPLVYVALLLAALTTQLIGIHAVFGAFLFGAVIPHHSRIAQNLGAKLHDVVTILLLPAFFAVTGMNTQISLISGTEAWLMCGLIILVATVCKFGATLLASRLVGLDWRTGSALGVLMNTRGLMELIVLNIGLSLGVISPKLFAMMVIMALVTTLATAPLLRWLIGPPWNLRNPQTSDLGSPAAA